MSLKSLITAAALTLGTLGFATTASATVFTFDGNAGGQLRGVNSTFAYDDVNQKLDINFNQMMDGQEFFSLVLSTSRARDADPTQSAAVLFVDLAKQRVAVYDYAGNLNRNSSDLTRTYNAGNFIAGFDAAASGFTRNGRNVSFSLDTAAINTFGGAGWTGAAFGPDLHAWMTAYWYRGTPNFRYAANGRITRGAKDDGRKHGDFHGTTTQTPSNPGGDVPVPAGLAFIAVAAAAAGARKRR